MKHLDIFAHIFLILGITVGAVAIYRLRFDSTSQFLVILIITLFYLLWGTTYHHLKGKISQKQWRNISIRVAFHFQIRIECIAYGLSRNDTGKVGVKESTVRIIL